MPEPPNNTDLQPAELGAEVSAAPRYPDSRGVVAPTRAPTAATPRPPGSMAPEAEAAGGAYNLMQEVPPAEQEYREESGYGKKKQDSPVKLAMRRLSAKIEVGGVAKRFGDVMTKPWVIGEGAEGGERRRIEIGRGLYTLEEGNGGAGDTGAGEGGRAGGSGSKKRSGAGDKWDINCGCS